MNWTHAKFETSYLQIIQRWLWAPEEDIGLNVFYKKVQSVIKIQNNKTRFALRNLGRFWVIKLQFRQRFDLCIAFVCALHVCLVLPATKINLGGIAFFLRWKLRNAIDQAHEFFDCECFIYCICGCITDNT